VVGGYAQYAIRPAHFLVPVPDGVDPTEAVCIPLAYLTTFQILTPYRNLPLRATILVIGAAGTVGTALLDLARHFRLKAIGTCSVANLPVIGRYGAAAIDYRAGDFVTSVVRLTTTGPGVEFAFYAIGGAFCSFVRMPGARRVARRMDGPEIGRTKLRTAPARPARTHVKSLQ
jgi:NADPH:quinone reductase-like Zn-dependent oxidoreductase